MNFSLSSRRRILLALAVVVLAALVLPAAAGACPLCRDAKSDSDYAGGTASLPNGFYYSILFMMGAPFAVLGTLAARIALARRKRCLAAGHAMAAGETDSAPGGNGPLVPDSAGSQV